jgi:hypothetical protein
MWRSWSPSRPRADLLVLQGLAEHAGSAWACSFSSSDEFEAAVIRAKLDAGIYGPKRRQRYALLMGLAAVTTCMLTIVLFRL